MLEQGSFVGEIADNSVGYMADATSDMERIWGKSTQAEWKRLSVEALSVSP
jgi:hypothetical protein